MQGHREPPPRRGPARIPRPRTDKARAPSVPNSHAFSASLTAPTSITAPPSSGCAASHQVCLLLVARSRTRTVGPANTRTPSQPCSVSQALERSAARTHGSCGGSPSRGRGSRASVLRGAQPLRAGVGGELPLARRRSMIDTAAGPRWRAPASIRSSWMASSRAWLGEEHRPWSAVASARASQLAVATPRLRGRESKTDCGRRSGPAGSGSA